MRRLESQHAEDEDLQFRITMVSINACTAEKSASDEDLLPNRPVNSSTEDRQETEESEDSALGYSSSQRPKIVVIQKLFQDGSDSEGVSGWETPAGGRLTPD